MSSLRLPGHQVAPYCTRMKRMRLGLEMVLLVIKFLMNLSIPFRIQKVVHELTLFFFLEPHIRAEQIAMINSLTWETCPERQAASLDPSHPCLARSLQNPGTKLRRGCCFLFT